jgi:hypothetical protein
MAEGWRGGDGMKHDDKKDIRAILKDDALLTELYERILAGLRCRLLKLHGRQQRIAPVESRD